MLSVSLSLQTDLINVNVVIITGAYQSNVDRVDRSMQRQWCIGLTDMVLAKFTLLWLQ